MKLEIYRRADGLFAWRLKAKNGRIIATDGGQGYASRKTCKRMALEVVRPKVRVGEFDVVRPAILIVDDYSHVRVIRES